MADHSAIEWTDATWTPIRARNHKTGKVGWHCEHATTGCENCYAEGINKRLGTGLPFKPGHRADIEIFLDEAMLTQPLRWKKPRRVFVCSMTDLFASFVTDEMIDRVFAVMALCPQHTFQVLTKRAERMRTWFAERWQPAPAQHLDLGGGDAIDVPAEETGHGRHEEVYQACEHIFELIPAMVDTENEALWNERGSLKCRDFAWPLPNVWLGVSAERQQEADERIPHLLQTPAAVRFVSLEPLLGPINLDPINCGGGILWNALGRTKGGEIGCLDWVIVGGESGRNARPMQIEWAESIRDQCRAVAVACFIKQLGAEPTVAGHPLELRDRKGGDWSEWPEAFRVREFPGVRP
jgi:protein gp37